MKFIRPLRPFLMILSLTITEAYAQPLGQETGFSRQLRNQDDQPLREFVESKENIDVRRKAQNLEISGDVRFEWTSIQEKGVALYMNPHSHQREISDRLHSPPSFYQDYRNLRGGKHVDYDNLPLSVNDFDVEFNLKIKYTFKDAWAKAHLQFDNPAGIKGRNPCFGSFPVFNQEGSKVVKTVPRDSRLAMKGSGEGMFLTLKRAYIGYNIFADGKHRLDLEIGRQKLDDIFDSEIQFSNRFDGALLRFASALEDRFDWYCLAGAFVIDERVNHFGYATEIGLLDIYGTGIDLKYSFIDWKKRGQNRCFIFNPLGTQFQNSQVTLTYTFLRKIFCKEMPFELYGGFLINHAAKKTVFSHGKKKNLGWYAGLYIGNNVKKGDWSFDIEYVGVQAQAVSEYDVGSIARGNILNETLLDIIEESFSHQSFDSSSFPSSYVFGYFPRRGNTNFVGWRFEFLYTMTDNFSVDMVYEFSNEEDQRIGGPHRYRDFEIEVVYAF